MPVSYYAIAFLTWQLEWFSSNHSHSDFRESSVYDSCNMYGSRSGGENGSSIAQKCNAAAFNPNTSIPCTDFVYDKSEFSSTLTTELDLVCDNVGKRHFLGSVMMMGLTLGSLLGGPIGEEMPHTLLFTKHFI